MYPIFFFISSYSVLMSYPATLPEPLVGWLSPVRMRMAVVLPAPLAPRNPNISPRRTLKLMSSTAWKSPKALTRCSTSMTFSSLLIMAAPSRSMPGGLNTSAKRLSIISGVSIPCTLPSFRKATLSHLLTSSRYGVEATIVIPLSLSMASISQNSLRLTGSTPVVGSSRKITSGWCTNAHDNASFCFMPPESAPALRLRKGSIWLYIALILSYPSSTVVPNSEAKNRRFSSTVRS